jgi:hypothetical protein
LALHNPTYVFLRRDTGTYFFRWVVPTKVRPLLGGRKEFKRSLSTDDKRLAIRLARRLAVTLDRGTFSLMSQGNDSPPPYFYLTVKLIERMIDGTLKLEGVEIDPTNAEEDRKSLTALVNAVSGAPVSSSSISGDQSKTLSNLVEAYLADGDRAQRWTAKSRSELEAIYSLMLEIMGPTTPALTLNREALATFKDAITKLPTNRNKDARYRGKTVPISPL